MGAFLAGCPFSVLAVEKPWGKGGAGWKSVSPPLKSAFIEEFDYTILCPLELNLRFQMDNSYGASLSRSNSCEKESQFNS